MGNAALKLHPSMGANAVEISPHEMFLRVGMLTRQLHDAMSELGGTVESAMSALPDARERLGYIGKITGQAAERVLCAAEAGKELQLALAQKARIMGEASYPPTATEMKAFICAVETVAAGTNEKFSQIILAQDFHDLSGQVLKRVIDL
ncbi:MAG: protein phosphatase CheZ, partial [Burkholderiales bacterium]